MVMELMPFSRVNIYQAYAHIVGNIFKSILTQWFIPNDQ